MTFTPPPAASNLHSQRDLQPPRFLQMTEHSTLFASFVVASGPSAFSCYIERVATTSTDRCLALHLRQAAFFYGNCIRVVTRHKQEKTKTSPPGGFVYEMVLSTESFKYKSEQGRDWMQNTIESRPSYRYGRAMRVCTRPWDCLAWSVS